MNEQFKIGDRVRIIKGFCYATYLESRPTDGVIIADSSDLPRNHGDWLVEVEGRVGGFAVDADDIESLPTAEQEAGS